MFFIVSELYYPEETSTGYILTKIAEGLAETLPVQVVTGPPDYSGVKAAPKTEVRNGVRITRVGGLSLNKNKIFSRVIRAIALSLKLAVKMLLVIKNGDVVLAVTNPAPLLVLMCLVCRVKRASLVILVHDVFPENIRAAKLIRGDSIWYSLLILFFNKVYKTSSHIIVIGRDMKALMRRKINVNCPEITVITNWADIENIHPEERSSNRLIKKLKIENTFIVQFAGNLGRVQGIEQIAIAAEILKNENIHFVFIGNGAKKKWLVNQVKTRQLTNVTVLDTMPRSEQQTFLNACDVGLISLASGMTGLGVPSKTYNILAAGKPIIALLDSSSEVGLLIEKEKIGWIVTPSDPEALACTIREASKSQDIFEMGQKSREIAETNYSFSKIIAQYREVLVHYESNK